MRHLDPLQCSDLCSCYQGFPKIILENGLSLHLWDFSCVSSFFILFLSKTHNRTEIHSEYEREWVPVTSVNIDQNTPSLVCVMVRLLSEVLPTFTQHSLWNVKWNIIQPYHQDDWTCRRWREAFIQPPNWLFYSPSQFRTILIGIIIWWGSKSIHWPHNHCFLRSILRKSPCFFFFQLVLQPHIFNSLKYGVKLTR